MNPIQQAEEALEDIINGWKYIRDSHGDLYGVGWDRAQDKAEAALTSLHSLQKEVEGVLPEPHIKACPAFVGALPDCYTADQLRTAVAAALGRGAVPSGWKLVPVEPTPEMRKAAADAWLDCDSKLFLNKAGAAVRAAIAISKESA